eukprot:COSAG05_NODE_944_length_6488_cov_11.788073_6_plen_93_part_00
MPPWMSKARGGERCQYATHRSLATSKINWGHLFITLWPMPLRVPRVLAPSMAGVWGRCYHQRVVYQIVLPPCDAIVLRGGQARVARRNNFVE